MMTWKPIDFQGIVALDKSVIEHLQHFLEEKEARLAEQILEAFPIVEAKAPAIPPGLYSRLKLSDAIEGSSKRIRQMALSRQKIDSSNGWKKAARSINRSLWEYIEVLEGSSVELFQQLDQVGIEQWRGKLSLVIDEIKVMLIHRVDDVVWAIRRLEEQLQEYRKICLGKNRWMEFLSSQKPLLEENLLDNLDKTKKYLSLRYHHFADRFCEFNKMRSEVDKLTLKMDAYHVLSVLDAEAKEKYRKLFQLLHLWELNKKAKKLPEGDPVYAIRTVTSFERAYIIFKDYYNMLRLVLFERSRNLKSHPKEIFEDVIGKSILLEVIKGFKDENDTLENVISKYREFLLDNDPHPQISKWWRFWGWKAGEEPAQTKQLHFLLADVEMLEVYFQTLEEAIQKGPSAVPMSQLQDQMAEVQKHLREMGQPLASKALMRLNSERVISLLSQMDEIGSFNQVVVDFIGESLSKALRADWKYQVLFDIQEFYDVYSIHQGIAYLFEDRQHTARLNKFKRLIQQIDEWVKNKTYPKHIHEIELDMNDMKGYLQDFLGQVQRFAREPISDLNLYDEQLRELYRQLLEYRYLFGTFFHELRDDVLEERNIRNHFLFVDQYFETIDNKIHEIKTYRPE